MPESSSIPLPAFLVAGLFFGACADDAPEPPSVVPTFRDAAGGSALASLVGKNAVIELGSEHAAWALEFRLRDNYRAGVFRLEASEARLEDQFVRTGEAGVLATTHYQALLPEPLPPILLDVTTSWRTNPEGDGALGSIEVELDARQPPEIYLSSVEFPRLAIPSWGADETLILPWSGGFAVEQPVEQEIDLDPIVPGFLSFPALALIDGANGSYVYLSNTDQEATLKRVILRSDPERDRMLFGVVQYPEQPWSGEDYVAPYEVEIALGHGDWYDVARRYNRFLRREADWFQPRIPDPDPAWFGTFYAGGGSIPQMGAATGSLAVDLGPGLALWHDVSSPDGIDCSYREGYLPGATGYRDARTRAIAGGLVQVAPFVQGSRGWDPLSSGSRSGHEAQTESTVRLEDGSRFLIRKGDCVNAYQCPGSDWWSVELPYTIASIDERLGLDAVFLGDFAFPGSCFDPLHRHPSGNGSWFAEAKLEQLRGIRSELGRDVTIAVEGVSGRFFEEVDLMFIDPFRNSTPFDGSKVRSLPLFRVAFEGQRLATLDIREDVALRLAGQVAYRQAFRFLQAGLTLSTGRRSSAPLGRPTVGQDRHYRRYLGSLARLRTEHDFARFHRGRLCRTPELEIDGLFSNRTDATGLPGHKPLDMQLLPRALYRDTTSDQYAFVITNPWIGPCPIRTGDLTVDYVASIELAEYPELKNRFLQRELTSLEGKELAHAAALGDQLRFVGRLAPGETHLWTITPGRLRR